MNDAKRTNRGSDKKRRAFFTIRSAEGFWKRPSRDALERIAATMREIVRTHGRH